MRFFKRGWVAVAFVVFGEACGTETPQPPASSGGTPATGGQPTGGTTVGTGGMSGGTTGGTAPATGGKATGGSATGGTASGGKASGGSSTGGTPTGGSATGGNASGGTATGGAATGGKATGGASTGGSSNSGPAYMPAFIIGADISRVQQTEDGGTRFRDVDGSTPSGTASTGGGLLTILKNHGFNYVRLRTFVNPAASGGYSSQGYCDLAHTIRFGVGIKQAAWGSCSTSTTATTGLTRAPRPSPRPGPT